jgi:hypothetical protein
MRLLKRITRSIYSVLQHNWKSVFQIYSEDGWIVSERGRALAGVLEYSTENFYSFLSFTQTVFETTDLL